MKKLGKGIIKIFCFLTVLLILVTAGLLLYPKYSEKLGLEEKVNEILKDKEQESEETASAVLNEAETQTESETEEHWEQSTEADKKEEFPQLTKAQQDDIHNAYLNILSTMGYHDDAVLFYEIKKIGDKDYYAFQVLDGERNAFEYLLLSEINTKTLYWCDSNGSLGNARPTDVLYTSNKPGKINVAYDDRDWKTVLNGYMSALLEKRNLEEAEGYRDDSYFYATAMSEKERKKNIDEAVDCQKELVDEVQQLQNQKDKGQLLSCKTDYKILKEGEREDAEGAVWKEVTIQVTLSGEKEKEIEQEDYSYLVSLRRYDYGWRIATLNRINS